MLGVGHTEERGKCSPPGAALTSPLGAHGSGRRPEPCSVYQPAGRRGHKSHCWLSGSLRAGYPVPSTPSVCSHFFFLLAAHKTSPLSKSTAEFRPTDKQPLPQDHYSTVLVSFTEIRCADRLPLVIPAANRAPQVTHCSS